MSESEERARRAQEIQDHLAMHAHPYTAPPQPPTVAPTPPGLVEDPPPVQRCVPCKQAAELSAEQEAAKKAAIKRAANK